MVENSIRTFVHLVETPCQCCLNVDDDFVWGYNLVDTQFKPVQPIFLLTLRMDENGAFYSTDPAQFEVKPESMIKYLIFFSLDLFSRECF